VKLSFYETNEVVQRVDPLEINASPAFLADLFESSGRISQQNGARSTNWSHGEDIIIAGAVSEWVLMGLQRWRSVARHSRATFDVSERLQASYRPRGASNKNGASYPKLSGNHEAAIHHCAHPAPLSMSVLHPAQTDNVPRFVTQ
jgi:hypothetical protein